MTVSIWGWLFVLVSFGFVMYMAFYTRRYIRDAVDFLAAGRVGGRYVLSVAGMESALGLMALIGMVEMKYRSGLSLEFWNVFLLPLGMILSLSGFCLYRYRQTRSLSLGEFLERRYNRVLRIFAMILRTTAEMLTNTIGPALSARVFIYLFGWPAKIHFLGLTIDTFMLVMAVTLILALTIISCGGMLSLLVTDCLQGLLCYPIFVIFTIYLFYNFSWDNEIVPTLANRVPGENFLNPFDISELKEFNVFAIFVTIFGTVLNRGIWYGGGQTSSARTPHEQKMSGILGELRGAFSSIMTLLFALMVIVIFQHPNHFKKAHHIRQELSRSVVADIISDPAQAKHINNAVAQIQAEQQVIDKLSLKKNYDTTYLDTVKQAINANGETGAGNAKFQEYRTLYHQMMFPVMLRETLPDWLMAVMCLLLIMLMVSTDDSKMFSSSLTLTQDIIIPLYGKPLPVKKQLILARWLTFFVAVVFFFGSLFLAQLDYIRLYTTIVVSIWAGGAGPVVLFGLYSRFGNTVGAFTSLILGSSTSLGGVLIQRNWADHIYPFLERHGWVDGVGNFLATVSKPFNPYIQWEMDAVKCPISSYEFFFLAMIIGISGYVIGSMLTNHGKRFDLDKMLHRDEENASKAEAKKVSWIHKLIGINQEYTTGDKVIAWFVFCYSVMWRCGIAFLGAVVWNLVSRWELKTWGTYFFVTLFAIPCVLGVFTTFWFLIGGIRDMRQLFRDLEKRKIDEHDNGFVIKNSDEQQSKSGDLPAEK